MSWFYYASKCGAWALIRERVRKTAGVMRQIWGIGKRRFKKD